MNRVSAGNRQALSQTMRRASRTLILFTALTGLAAVFVLVAYSAPQGQSNQSNTVPRTATSDWKAVEQALGKAASMQPDDVYKFSLPRSDLKVTVNGIELKPALALGFVGRVQKDGRHDNGNGRPRSN